MVISADAATAETVRRAHEDPKVEIFLSPHECVDPGVQTDADGKMQAKNCLLVQINGIPWRLWPGRNQVPLFVAEFINQQREDYMRGMQENEARQKQHLVGRL